jgi:hypothetical protein
MYLQAPDRKKVEALLEKSVAVLRHWLAEGAPAAPPGSAPAARPSASPAPASGPGAPGSGPALPS